MPTQYFEDPECFEPFKRDIIHNEFIEPMDPMMYIEHPAEATERFLCV